MSRVTLHGSEGKSACTGCRRWTVGCVQRNEAKNFFSAPALREGEGGLTFDPLRWRFLLALRFLNHTWKHKERRRGDHSASSRRTHPDDLLVQPAAPRQLCARIHRRVGGELELRLEALGLAVGEHRPRPGLLTRLRLRGQPDPLSGTGNSTGGGGLSSGIPWRYPPGEKSMPGGLSPSCGERMRSMLKSVTLLPSMMRL
ncbi:hypothetical protein EYF80_018700 [Liparis tanakae]|uniref:Uncharacterized protein n=1 Tax=Liparis tanakae TaxID=230148 RepID=A0A4Z2HYV1_9TELE|nr:hypothetical protein EYF80_018700 [Liparis tanakae]